MFGRAFLRISAVVAAATVGADECRDEQGRALRIEATMLAPRSADRWRLAIGRDGRATLHGASALSFVLTRSQREKIESAIEKANGFGLSSEYGLATSLDVVRLIHLCAPKRSHWITVHDGAREPEREIARFDLIWREIESLRARTPTPSPSARQFVLSAVSAAPAYLK